MDENLNGNQPEFTASTDENGVAPINEQTAEGFSAENEQTAEGLSADGEQVAENGVPADGEQAANGVNLAGMQENTSDQVAFNPEAEQEKKTEDKVANAKKHKKTKWFFIIPLIFLILISLLFIIWQISPKKGMNVCVLDKTILTVEENNDINIDSVYRKHQGLFWLLEQQKYVFQNGDFYDTKQDYFGPILDEEGQIKEERALKDLDYEPDLMYVSDVYGAVNDTYGYYDKNDAKNAGVTVDEMSVISYAYESNATIVAEMELFNSNLNSSIHSQLASLCGVKPTGWVGRYIYDLQDFTDVPDWAPPMYEQQEGVEWQFSGPGILLVSDEKIIILEQKTDFESRNLLQIFITDEYKKEFKHCDRVNFYNWFEIVEPVGNTEVIANFEFDVNATGMEKLKGVLRSPVFCAATRKVSTGKAPVYYFAADFNDYVSHLNYNRFMFANTVYRWIAFDRQGDITNFYWNFYDPLMTKILSYVNTREIIKNPDENAANVDRTTHFSVSDNGFRIKGEDDWEKISFNAVSINAHEPGKSTYSRNYGFYENLVRETVTMGANCIYAKDILPPEFYRAIYANNSSEKAKKVYLIQNITPPDEISQEEWQKKAEAAVNVLNGKGSYSIGNTDDAIRYFIDTSNFVAAITFDGFDPQQQLSYSGEFASGEGQTGYPAFIYDTIQKYAKDEFDMQVPIGINLPAGLVKGTGLEGENAISISDIITDSECKNNYSFTVISYKDTNGLVTEQGEKITTDGDKMGGAFALFREATNGRYMVNNIVFSANCGTGNDDKVTEKQQGQQTVAALRMAKGSGALCAIASDLNDDWSELSDSMYAFTSPLENNSMWQNVADPAQTTGFIALDPEEPEKVGINMTDDDRVQMLSLSSNEGYFYLTAQLLTDIDYEKEKLFIGIDTYQRNDGEYYYSKEYTPTSLSGMEFVLAFDSKQQAGLYVTSTYDKKAGRYATKESYTGDYGLVSQLTYGGFSSVDNQFYQSGSTIYIRIPWAWLNVTDPSQKIVINNDGEISGQAKTVTTNGAVVSVLIADKQTKDQLYLFPETKQEPSYKTYKWATWEKVSYSMREKESFTILKNYFSKENGN